MEIGETLRVSTREEWRAWLAEHHQDKPDIWLILYKSGSGKRSLPFNSAQEEALCWGWTDSTLKPIDAECYALRFSPRRKSSQWGRTNKARALRMLREGRMSPAGMAALPPDVIRAWEEGSRAAK